MSIKCAGACQYAIDIGMPEYKCSGECMYAKQYHEAVVDLARKDIRLGDDLEIDDFDVKVSDGDDNGAWVSCWMWVDFWGTPLSKEDS